MSATLNDGVIYSLASFSGDANARIAAWLRTKIAVPPTVPTALNDLWTLYMDQIPVSGGTTDERISRFMKAIIGTDVPNLTTYNDIQNAFWNGAYAPNTPTSGNAFTNRVATGWTITRASGATDTGLTGLYTQVANNTAYYNADKGIYSEEARTNQFLNSDTLTTGWTPTRLTVTTGADLAPDGSLNSTRLTPTATAGSHSTVQNITSLGNTNEVLSIYAKPNGYSILTIDYAGSIQLRFNLQSLQITDITAGVTNARITASANGWYRCQWTFDLNVGAGTFPYTVGVADNSNNTLFVSDNASGILVWGIQHEIGFNPTTYIKTAGTAVTRPITDISRASIVGMTGDNFTIRIVVTVLLPFSGVRYLFSMDNGAGQSITLRESSDGVLSFARTTTAGANGLVVVTVGFLTPGGTIDIEFEQSTVAGMAMRVNGTTVTDTNVAAKQAWSGVLPSVHLGCQNPTGTPGNSITSTIAMFQFWNVPVPIIYIP